MLNRYGTFLTCMLVIVVVSTAGGLVHLGMRMITTPDLSEEGVRRFENERVTDNRRRDENSDYYEFEREVGLVDIENEEIIDEYANLESGEASRRRTYYRGYVRVGTIHIPATNITYPILENNTNSAIEKAVAVMWPQNPESRVNEPGNLVITGHNFRDGTFFANNSRLNIGDRVLITDNSGRRITYEIFEMFEACPTDTTHILRDTGGYTEITLSTCTDDAVRRLVIKARALL